MQIPQELNNFEKKTIIVVTDSVQAKLFLAEDRQVEELDQISTKLEKLDQDRDTKITPGGVRSGDEHADNQDWTRDQLYSELNKDLMIRLQKDEFEELVFTVPQEHRHELEESLHPDLISKTQKFIPKLLTKEGLVDILKQLQ